MRADKYKVVLQELSDKLNAPEPGVSVHGANGLVLVTMLAVLVDILAEFEQQGSTVEYHGELEIKKGGDET